MGKTLTQTQSLAVNDRGRSLLVSAAAGSGKTTVLTERIVKRVAEDGVDISKLLVVTFTKAAAAEIRARLSETLSQLSARDPSDFRLFRQAAAVGSANIDTNDAFFLRVVRQNSEKVGLPSGFSVCDENTAGLLLSQAAQTVVERYFEEKSEDDPFFEAVECFTDGSAGETLAGELISLRERLVKLADPGSVLENCAESFEAVADGRLDYLASPIGKALAEEVSFIARRFQKLAEEDEESALGGEFAPYAPTFAHLREFFGVLAETLEGGALYKDVFDLLKNFKKVNFGPVKKCTDEAEKKRLTNDRELMQKTFLKDRFQDVFFACDEDGIRLCAARQARVIRVLASLNRDIEAEFSAEKRARGVIDFSDMAHMCYSLFFDKAPDGTPVPTELARSVSSQFSEIFIDEYQDTDPVQDAIFSAISELSGAPCFCVGDVKQSIYAFRGAEPDLFIKYYETRRDVLSPEGDAGEPRKIILSENFRSDSEIIDTVNMLFSKLMTKKNGGIVYDGDARLVRAEGKRDSGHGHAELLFAQNDLEPDACADEAARLLSDPSLGYAPEDIAFLFFKNDGTAPYVKALTERGIPVAGGANGSFFKSAEVLVILDVLAAIENPLRDVPLAGAMCGPVFGFTFDELSRIRFSAKGSLWDAVREAAKTDEKARVFTERLERYRKYSLLYGAERLISLIVRENSLDRVAAAAPDGKKRRAGILRLMRTAKEAAACGYSDLPDFIAYTENLMKKSGEAGTDAPGVRILTIHRSKGLEFKAVFVCKLNSKPTATGNENKSVIVFDKKFGAALKLKDESGLVNMKNPVCAFADFKMRKDNIPEKMRLLYVALTRAKERLYLSAAEGDLPDKYEECDDLRVYLSNSYTEWILRAAASVFGVEALKTDGVYGGSFTVRHADPNAPRVTYSSAPAKVPVIPEIVPDFVYEGAANLSIPAKISVSELLRDEDDAFAMYERKGDAVPVFMQSAGGSDAAEAGTAMHAFMQFCDMERAAADVSAEADRLVREFFITERQRSLLDNGKLSRFFASPLYEAVRNAKTVWREMRFNVVRDASTVTENGRGSGVNVLMQGVIDCFFERAGGDVVLLDFKTDRTTDRAELLSRHAKQLEIYKDAVERMTGKTVAEAYIYSFSLSEAIPVGKKV